MNGIPIEVVIDGDRETVYLATGAPGDAGRKMQTLKREFHQAHQRMVSALQRVSIVANVAMNLDPAIDDYAERIMTLLDGQDAANDSAMGSRTVAGDCARDLVETSLRQNYGPEQADRYLAVLTDREINNCVGIIETGDVPADFMQSRATRPSGSTTTPDADGLSRSSSGTDSTLPTSTPES